MFRTVLDYYSGEVDEDAYDMRKALSRYSSRLFFEQNLSENFPKLEFFRSVILV
jgi:hypothetical protein